MSLFWNMHYGGHVAAEAAGARSAARDAGTRVAELEARLDRMALACQAMWTLLSEKLQVSEEELLNRVNDLDLSDGKLDGKVRRSAGECGKCGRKVARRFPRCIYCGTVMQQDPFAG